MDLIAALNADCIKMRKQLEDLKDRLVPIEYEKTVLQAKIEAFEAHIKRLKEVSH